MRFEVFAPGRRPQRRLLRDGATDALRRAVHQMKDQRQRREIVEHPFGTIKQLEKSLKSCQTARQNLFSEVLEAQAKSEAGFGKIPA